MASIPYLTGGESPTAALMNKVFTDASISLDAKLSKLLHGKSFFLARTAQPLQRLCGKAFFFTSGTAVYASRVPGYINNGGGVARPYNHAQFTTAVAGINFASCTFDETKHIANVPPFAAGAYSGLPQARGVGLCDWSLQAHYISPTVLNALAISNPGTGYTVNDILTFTGGTGDPAKVKVTAVASGVITAIEVTNFGHYSAAPTSPASVTGGTGSGATFTFSSAAVNYYIDETGTGTGGDAPPEKKYKYALAEIIIEGPTSVTLPASYDKYACFRIHNLNHAAATVTFTSGATVNLAALECCTVRRDSPTTNYRVRQRSYFFAYEGGDPRAYWFMPKADGGSSATLGEGNAVTNSHQANNLFNPAVALDWANYFVPTFPIYAATDPVADYGWYAWWNQDASVQCDVGGFYTSLFGNPADESTKLGDLIHHRGEIVIVRQSKTLTDPITLKPLLTFDSMTFNGYATIVADFAAKLMSVTTDGSGNYVISGNDPDNWIQLVPVGTNLFKSGETLPSVVNLRTGSRTIESAVFEAPDYTALSATAPQLIFHPTASLAANTKNYTDVNQVYPALPPITVVGDQTKTLNWNTTRSTAKTINGIHNVTVGDLLKMDWFGDPAQGYQTTEYVEIVNRKLRFTPQGLVLTFVEERSSINPTGSTSYYNDWAVLRQSGLNTREIRFRGNGWGYYSATEGARASAWLSPRKGRYQVTTAYTDDVLGTDGADFTLNSFSAAESSIKVLGRIKASDLGVAARDARFWQCTEPGDRLASYFKHKADLTAQEFGALWDLHFAPGGDQLIPAAAGLQSVAMGLLPEMYNGLARAVNAITRGVQLNWMTLRWNVSGASVGLGRYEPTANNGMANRFNGGGASVNSAGSSYPLPMDCFTAFDAGSQFQSLCTLLSIPVLSAADFPGGRDTRDNSEVAFSFFQGLRNYQTYFSDRCVSVAHSSTSTVTLTSSLGAWNSGTAEAVGLAKWVGFAGTAGGTFNLVSTSGNQLYNFRWCRISDVKAAIEAAGFNFFLAEACLPLALRYFEGAMIQPSSPKVTVEELDVVQNRDVFGDSGSYGSCYGALIKFVPTGDSAEAKWKLFNTVRLQSVPPVTVGFSEARSEQLGRHVIGFFQSLTSLQVQANPAHGTVINGVANDQVWPNVSHELPYITTEFAGDLFLTSLSESTIAPQLSPIAFNLAFTTAAEAAEVPILLASRGVWVRQEDFTPRLYDIYGFTYHTSYIPPAWLPADRDYAPTFGNGLNIISRIPDLPEGTPAARYWALFDVGQPAIKLGDSVPPYGVTAADPTVLASDTTVTAASGY
jgi:hypothetical protein